MRKVKLVVAVLLALTLFMTVESPAGQVLDRILQRKELIVGTSGTQPPLTVKTKSGKLIGLDIDLCKLMAEAMGVKLKLIERPFHQLLPAIEAGMVDMVVSGMTMTPKRNLHVAFAGPYYVSGKGVLTKTHTAMKLQDAKAMNQKNFRVAALKGSTSQLFVEGVAPKAVFIQTKSLEEAVELLLNDKVDALIADHPFCAVNEFRYRDKGLAAGGAPFTFEPLGIALPPGDPLLSNWVDNFLTMLEGNGGMKVLKKQWFNPGPWMNDLP